MNREGMDLIPLLAQIPPDSLTYSDWVMVGMALKHEGYPASDWDQWSQADVRYKAGECFAKWTTFREDAGKPVTGATIVQMAKDRGWQPQGRREIRELDWDDIIGEREEGVIIDATWLEGKEIEEPKNWSPAKDLITYLETLFSSEDYVGYVTKTYQNDEGEYKPQKGTYSRTAGQIIQDLRNYDNDIGASLGDYKTEVGAWIRFNPLDGQGVNDKNVVDYRYALVESDSMALDDQHAIIRELELPVACLVHSGNKSLHAIVRVEAASYEEYRKRVDYLYEVCQKNGLKMDTANKNPSRLSRMPGVMRGEKKQFLIATNIGKRTWNEWREWIEAVNDDLPDPETLIDYWDNMPDLAPPLIDGVLRQGHKMLLAGPSKAGKSYALIELTIGIAEGRNWLGWGCTKGRVMYVNLELDRASALHRFKDVYTALGWAPSHIDNIDIWNLRGKSVPLDKLAPKLIRRAAKRNYIAIIIDPIYKVITGDENSADQMAHFTNQFDKICTELGTAVIYCHHHSKGYQGNKRSMDRASGSGVFARDPDALLDLSELDISGEVSRKLEEKLVTETINRTIAKLNDQYYEFNVRENEQTIASAMQHHASKALSTLEKQRLDDEIEAAKQRLRQMTAWRIEGTLREYPKFDPLNIFFSYPIHQKDYTGLLEEAEVEGEKAPWQKAIEKRKPPEKKKEERSNALEIAYSTFEFEGKGEITVSNLAEELGVTNRTLRTRVKEHGGFDIVSPGPGLPSHVIRKDIDPGK